MRSAGPPVTPEPVTADPTAEAVMQTEQPTAGSSGADTAVTAAIPAVVGPPEILSPPRTKAPSDRFTFSHEGPRYLLGYGEDSYAIWDKANPGPPIRRFPRTDAGWREAWEAFMRLEMGQA
jgi:hypothetical protein